MPKDIARVSESRSPRAEPKRQGVSRPTPDSTIAAMASLASSTGGIDLPKALTAKMEHAFGTSFSAVRVHPNSGQAARMGAEAFATGEHVHFAPGRYRPDDQGGHSLVGHELAHVVQQRSGRAEADVQYAGVELSTDRSLEDEADRAGERAARGERVGMAVPPSPPPGPRQTTSSTPVVQAKLGFELEMYILVDVDGRPLPEKSQIGSFGDHISLDIDQAPELDSPTPSAALGADYDLPQSAALTKRWFHAGSDTLYDTEDAAKLAHGDTLPGVTVYYWDEIVRRWRGEEEVDWTVEWYHAGTTTTYATEAAARLVYPDLAGVVRRYRDSGGTLQGHHISGAGMGNARYASILEMVTGAYAPETLDGATKIVEAMTEAKALADLIEAETYKTGRFQLNSISGDFHDVSDRINFGHDSQAKQTTDASIQTTLGIDIAQFASFVTSTMGYFLPQQQFLLKHDSDYKQVGRAEEIYIARAHMSELPKALLNATTIINEIGHTYDTDKTSTLVNLRGLLTLACQYLRMGKYAYNNGRFVLDKNLTPVLSRTDLCDIRKNQLRDDERAWLAEHIVALKTKTYAKTERDSTKSVYTDPTETQVYDLIALTVAQFVDNVFTGDEDGITSHLGGFKRIAAEDIDPSGTRTEAHKRGPVFELRNMIPGAVGDRFPRSSWVDLATYMANLLFTLNARNDAAARKDAKITISDTGAVTTTEKPNW